MNVYEIVTQRIIEQLNDGIIPWLKPWYGTTERAQNYVSRKPYSLLNQMLLGGSGYYMTYKQVMDKGGKVKKGSHANVVVFWKMLPVDEKQKDGTTKKKLIPMLRYYNVFAQSDIEGIDFPEIKHNNEAKPEESADNIIKAYIDREETLKFITDQDGNRAFYSPANDEIHVPAINQFAHVEEYYSTAFHEMTHSTGHTSRLNREFKSARTAKGEEVYSKEELIAELGAAALVNHAGLESKFSFTNSAAYIKSWLSVLANDPKFIVSASSRAEKAVNFILNGKTAEEFDTAEA